MLCNLCSKCFHERKEVACHAHTAARLLAPVNHLQNKSVGMKEEKPLSQWSKVHLVSRAKGQVQGRPRANRAERTGAAERGLRLIFFFYLCWGLKDAVQSFILTLKGAYGRVRKKMYVTGQSVQREREVHGRLGQTCWDLHFVSPKPSSVTY